MCIIAAGDAHTVVLNDRNELWGCGDNQCGQLGLAVVRYGSIIYGPRLLQGLPPVFLCTEEEQLERYDYMLDYSKGYQTDCSRIRGVELHKDHLYAFPEEATPIPSTGTFVPEHRLICYVYDSDPMEMRLVNLEGNPLASCFCSNVPSIDQLVCTETGDGIDLIGLCLGRLYYLKATCYGSSSAEFKTDWQLIDIPGDCVDICRVAVCKPDPEQKIIGLGLICKDRRIRFWKLGTTNHWCDVFLEEDTRSDFVDGTFTADGSKFVSLAKNDRNERIDVWHVAWDSWGLVNTRLLSSHVQECSEACTIACGRDKEVSKDVVLLGHQNRRVLKCFLEPSGHINTRYDWVLLSRREESKAEQPKRDECREGENIALPGFPAIHAPAPIDPCTVSSTEDQLKTVHNIGFHDSIAYVLDLGGLYCYVTDQKFDFIVPFSFIDPYDHHRDREEDGAFSQF